MLIRAATLPIELFFAPVWHATRHGCHAKAAIGRDPRLSVPGHATTAGSANFLQESQENRIAHFIDPMPSASKLQGQPQLRSDDVSMSAQHAQVSHRQVFVLDLGRPPAFAFATGDVEEAQHIVRSPWLLRALDAFCRRRPPDGWGGPLLRPATDDEASIYHDRAAEFAEDVTTCLLIVHVGAD